jgi:hypothetical protein
MHPAGLSIAAVALLLFPALASASPPTKTKPTRTAHVVKSAPPKTCTKPDVEVATGAESATFALAKCDGTPAPLAVDQLSILARPASAAKPKAPVVALAKGHGTDVAPGIKRIDARLVQRLEQAVDHFRKPGQTPKVLLVSGYRPKSAGSFHQSGRALDFRIEGVTNEALVAFCKTLPDTGCGYYPNSLFVHMDARDAGAGHVAWIDASKPGEAPKYVSSWPPSKDDDGKLPSLPVEPTDSGDGGKRARDGHVYIF